jgi:hypothetical protein
VLSYTVGTHTECTECTYANDTYGLYVQLQSLYLLKASFPLKIILSTSQIGGLKIKLTFSGVSPFLLILAPCPSLNSNPNSDSYTGPSPNPGMIAIDPNLLQTAIFRRNITAGDRADLLTYNQSSLIVGTNDYIKISGSD